MAHGIKYRIQYYRLRSGGLTTIDILQRSYAGTITTLLGGMSPFESSFEGNPNNIYEPTMGSGAVINIVNTTPLSLLEFFTADPQEWKIQVWDGVTDTDSDASSDGGGKLRWQGFISPEIYREGYSNPIASEMTVQCNDGMQVLDYIQYKDNTEIYFGQQTVGEIFTNILSKIELEFRAIYISNDMKITSTNANIFTQLELFNENFIDELEEPMSCRQVLESIIGGLGLVMFFDGYDIYIIDPINLHDTNKGKKYLIDVYTESSFSIGGYLDITGGEIPWGKTGSEIDIIPAVNEAVVKYNPYNFYEQSYNFADPVNWGISGTFVDMSGYFLNSIIEYNGWSIPSASTMMIAMKNSEFETPEYVLRFNGSEDIVSYTDFNMVTIEDESLRLKISIKVYIQTKEDSANIFDNGTTKEVNRLIIPVAIKVGEQYWKGTNIWEGDEIDKWQPFVVFGSTYYPDFANEQINDKWIEASIMVPLWNYGSGALINGQVQIEFLDEFLSTFADQIYPGDTPFFFTDTEEKTNSFGQSGVSWVAVTNTQIQITIVGFKAWAGIPNTHILFDNGITAMETSLPSGTEVTGVYHDSLEGSYNFSSSVADSVFSISSYNAATDTLVFTVTTNSTPYFDVNFDHFSSGNIYNLIFTYNYLSVLVFVKDVKLEVISMYSDKNVGNNGVEEKAKLLDNLIGKKTFEITTTCGTGLVGCSKGAFKSSVIDQPGANITGLFRGDDIIYYSNAKLLLQSFMSQYKEPRKLIKGKLNVVNQPYNIRTKLIKDSNRFADIAFYMVSGTYYDREEMMDVLLLEIEDTRDEISS